MSSSSDIVSFASVLAQFRGSLRQFLVKVISDFLEEFSALRRHASSPRRNNLNELRSFELLEDLADVASTRFRGVIWGNAEAFPSAVIRSKFFQAHRFMGVNLTQDACSPGVPPIRVLRLLLDVAPRFRHLRPCGWLNLVNVFFQVLG